MRVLALDLGTHTGWAYFDGHRVESGTMTFDLKRGESPGCRYLRFNRWIREEFGADPLGTGVDLVVYEQTHNRGGAATEVAAGFATRVQEWAAEIKVQHASVHTATLKKHATGSGRAGKPDMIEAALARQHTHAWPTGDLTKLSDDEIDALWLLDYARHTWADTKDVTP
jgi:hypothetical protein